MNFFQNLSALQVQGDWKITVKQTAADQLIISVLFNKEQCGDNASKLIPPLVLKGTAQEMDAGFFNAIEAPVKVTAQLLTNMEDYVKAQGAAQKQAAMNKTNTAGKSDKEKKYDAAMKKVDDLEEESKYREAWAKVPDPAEYPDKAEEIKERKAELAAQFEPDLFS